MHVQIEFFGVRKLIVLAQVFQFTKHAFEFDLSEPSERQEDPV